MATAGLSDSAVALLHFKLQGLRVPITEQRLPAFRELAAAGLMEPVSAAETEFRMTEAGLRHGTEIVWAERDRIERERYAPPDKDISDAARETLRRHLAGERKVTPENLPAYRELAGARIMTPLNGFVGGPEASFRLTYWGYQRRFELAGIEATAS